VEVAIEDVLLMQRVSQVTASALLAPKGAGIHVQTFKQTHSIVGIVERVVED